MSPAVLLVLALVTEPDPALTERARVIASAAGLSHEVTVFVYEPWREARRVDARTRVLGNHVTVYISPILADEMDNDGMTGLLAHELAHVGTTCGRDGRYPDDDAAVACESRADARAAGWVGRTTAIRGLCQVMAIAWDWRYTTDGTVLTRRIRLLHDRRDIR